MNNSKERTSPLTAVIMIPVALIVALPLYYIVVNTFKTQAQTTRSPLGLPARPYFGNYTTVFHNSPLVTSFLNTLYVTALSIAVMLIVGSMAAFMTGWMQLFQVVFTRSKNNEFQLTRDHLYPNSNR